EDNKERKKRRAVNFLGGPRLGQGKTSGAQEVRKDGGVEGGRRRERWGQSAIEEQGKVGGAFVPLPYYHLRCERPAPRSLHPTIIREVTDQVPESAARGRCHSQLTSPFSPLILTFALSPTGLHLTPSLPPSPRSCPLSLTRAPPQSQGVVSLPARLPDSPTSPPHPLRGDRLPIRNAAVATLPAPPPPPPPLSPTLIV
ncbi:hypothetical protein KUCAC02_015134, partial [Chaenocephalus aceratus]